MGKADVATKRYMADPARFADAFNYAVYGGEQVVMAGELRQLDTVSAEPGPRGSERRRDDLRLWRAMDDGHAVYALLGVERQSYVNHAMPVRGMLYDALAYQDQLGAIRRGNRHRPKRMSRSEYLSGIRADDRLAPVVTLVVYFSAGEWDGRKSLHDMLGPCDRRLLALVPDYRINLLSSSALADGEFGKFATDLGLVLGYIKYADSKDGLRDFVMGDDRFRSVDAETADLLSVLTDSRLGYAAGEEKVDMCKAIEDMRAEARDEGMEQGMLASVRGLMESVGWTAREALENLKVPQAEWDRYLAML